MDAMVPGDAIGRLGFRRWFERELVVSHLWLVGCIAGLTLMLGALENFSFRAPGAEPWIRAFLVLAGAFAGSQALARYCYLMVRALRFSDRSSCPSCATRERFDVVHASTLKVRCRKCGREWTIS